MGLLSVCRTVAPFDGERTRAWPITSSGNDLAGVNFSSGRLGIPESRDYWMELQNFCD